MKQHNLVHSLLKCNAVQKMIYCMVKQLITRVFTWFSIEQLDLAIDNCSTFCFCSIVIKLRKFLGTENQNRFIFMLLIKTVKYSFVEMWGNEKWKNEDSTNLHKSLLRNLLPRWINPIGIQGTNLLTKRLRTDIFSISAHNVSFDLQYPWKLIS
jgi:hypothetical protein